MPIITNAVVTAYCACKLCCGPSAPNPTASGIMPVQGITIAGPRAFPLGTKVKISGLTNTFILQDRTAKRFDGRWDIYLKSHDAALRFGKRTNTVTTYAPLNTR